MTESEKKFRVVASAHLNFYPGTMTPTPPEYRTKTHSEWMRESEAEAKKLEWAQAVLAEGWEFRIEERT